MMKISSLVKLGLVATALVVLPRRSSKKADCTAGCGCSSKTAPDEKIENPSCDSKKSDNSKSCKCPLCRIGKCPLCAIGKCFCGKKSADKAEKKGDCGCNKKSKK